MPSLRRWRHTLADEAEQCHIHRPRDNSWLLLTLSQLTGALRMVDRTFTTHYDLTNVDSRMVAYQKFPFQTLISSFPGTTIPTERTNETMNLFQRLNNLASIRFVSDLVSVDPIISTTFLDLFDCISPITTQKRQQTPYISPCPIPLLLNSKKSTKSP